MNPLAAPAALPTLTGSFSKAMIDHLGRLREGERRVRDAGDLEGVHLMRTSCRRLRATVQYLGDALPRETRKSFQQGLRGLMGALSLVRDLDVLVQAIDSVPGIEAAGAEALKKSMDERRAAAVAQMRTALDSEATAALLASLEQAASVPDDGTPVTWAAPARIADALSGSLRLKPADWTSAPEESLHDLRKAVKKIRYALEAFAPVYGRPVAKAIERCRDLQESLGVIQDASAFAAALQGVPSFSAGQFVATARARADAEIERRLPELWEKAFGPKAASRLGAHLFRRAVRGEAPADEAKSRRKAV